jgi:serine phosphatase RsbU (regulator of sigma subunit)
LVIDLCPGDLLVAFTDGVSEARNADGEEFGEERLKDLLRGAVGASVEQISSTLTDRIRGVDPAAKFWRHFGDGEGLRRKDQWLEQLNWR